MQFLQRVRHAELQRAMVEDLSYRLDLRSGVLQYVHRYYLA